MLETDFLIVGSGPAGISAAWPLVRAGRQVTMVDAASHPIPSPPKPDLYSARKSSDWWKDVLGSDLGGLRASDDTSPKLATPRGRAVLGGGEAGWPRVNSKRFIVARANNAGGLSSIWGAVCSEFDADDLADFAIGSADLAPSYRAVATRIGISGSDDELGSFHGHMPLQPPTIMTPPLARVLQRYTTRRPTREPDSGFLLGRSRNAILTADTSSCRLPCNGCGLCLHGCARGSIYDSASELINLAMHGNFRYFPNARVTRLVKIGGRQQSLEIRTEQGPLLAKAKRLILAAGTLNSTALVLEQAGLLGVRIRVLSNPLVALALLVPQAVGSPPPPQSFAMAQLSFRLALQDGSYATGAAYGADTLPLNMFARRIPLSRAGGMTLSALLVPATIPVNCFFAGKHSDNWMWLDGRGDDAVMTVEGNLSKQTASLLINSGKRLASSFSRFGAYLLPGSLTICPPGADLHHVGTIPMNGCGPLVCTETCELTHAPGVYVVDASWFPALPAKHCTFTIMANADRVATILSTMD